MSRTRPTTEKLAEEASRAVAGGDWQALTALLCGSLSPELMQPVLRVLRGRTDTDQSVLSHLARTLVRRLDVGAVAAVQDLRLWEGAPLAIREARLEAWKLLAAGRRGDRDAAAKAPRAWTLVIETHGFNDLRAQAQAVALIESAQAHWRSARGDGWAANAQRAVVLGSRAASVAAGLPHEAEALCVAGDAGLDLWRFSPGVGDLRQATKHAQQAFDLTPHDHPRKGWRAMRLASKLLNQSILDGTLSPLDAAMDLLADAPDLTADPEDRCGVLHELSRAAGRRWSTSRRRADLDASVDASRRAVSEVPPESQDIRIIQSGLAAALVRRGRETNDLADLREAVALRRALVPAERDLPRQGMVRINLANALKTLGERTRESALLDEAIEIAEEARTLTDAQSNQYPTRLHDLAGCYRARGGRGDSLRAQRSLNAALDAGAGRPEVEAVVANDLGSLLTATSDVPGAADAFAAALDALQRLQLREGQTSDRLIQLGRVDGVPANAVLSALRAGRDPLEIADSARAVVLSEILGITRSPQSRTRARDVLCVGAADTGGFALLRGRSCTRSIECPQLTGAAVLERLAETSRRLAHRRHDPSGASDSLEELSRWLGQLLSLDALDLPERLGLVTLGPLGLLPVHLSRYRGRPLCLHSAVTMCLRTATTRTATTPSRLRRGVIVDAGPEELTGNGLHDQEACGVRQAVDELERLSGPAATPDAALQAFSRADVAHFSGHAQSFPDRPPDSVVHLSDDRGLTVSDLLGSASRLDALLVTLSGCETAVAGRRVPDESVSLAAGAVAAGAKNVLSTLWPVSAVAAALVCRQFYARLRTSPDRPDLALREAQRWLSGGSEAELRTACQQIGAPVIDPQQLNRPLHWGSWTLTSA